MPVINLPLVGTFNTRSIAGNAALTLNQDQDFKNVTFNLVQNPVTGKATIYAEKRPGWGVDTSIPVLAMNLPGASGDYASTPDSAALDVVGDIDIRVRLSLDDWTPTNNQRMVYKRNVAPSYDFYVVATAGNLGFYDGTTTYVSNVTGFVNGTVHWVRVTRASATGTATFYTSDDGSTWTQLGSPVAGAAGALPSTASALWIGSDNGASFLAGKVYRAQILNGIAGTVVASFDARDATLGATTFTSSTTGEVYTLNGNASITATGTAAIEEASTAIFKPQSFVATLTAFGNTNSTIYVGTISMGTMTGRAIMPICETIISGVTYAMIRSTDGTGWYYASDAGDNTAYTMDGNNSTTVTDIKIAGVANASGLYPGQVLAASANIVAGTRVVSVNTGAFTAVLDTATTGGAFNDLAVTKTPIAKITDVDFITTGSRISAFVEMDGYLFYSTDDGNLRNSDLNSVTSYSSTGFKAVSMAPDPPVATYRHKNVVGVLGTTSCQAFNNQGYATGSPLENIPQAFNRIGCIDQRSVTTLENDTFFVSSPANGDVGVYRIRDFAPQKISPPNLDRIIGTVSATNGAIYASSYRLGGYPYLSLFMSMASDGPASAILLENGDYLLLENGDNLLLEDTAAQVASFARLFIYNTQLNIWCEWDATVATYIVGISSGSNNQILATSRVSSSGKVYTINPVSDGQLYRDDGSSYTMEIRTSKVMDGANRKFIEQVTLTGWDSTNTTMPYLSYSDDDYQTYSTPRQFMNIGGVPTLYRLGSHKNGRSYKITDSANAPFRAEGLGIKYAEAA